MDFCRAPFARFACCAVSLLLGACAARPPASQFPTGTAALDRMKATYDCARGAQGSAKIDHFNDEGRLRGEMMLFAVDPDRVRFDVISPFGVLLATLASDGTHFSFFDMKHKVFMQGPPTPCNIARLTQVRLPAHALVKLLRGEAPLLVHSPSAPSVVWSGRGFYVVKIPSSHEAVEEIHLAPIPADFDKPFEMQRVRVLEVSVQQRGFVHYRAQMQDHMPSVTMPPRTDPDGIDADIPPSGPVCKAEVPRRIHIEVPYTSEDLIVRYEAVGLNPPLPQDVFRQPMPQGVRNQFVNCN